MEIATLEQRKSLFGIYKSYEKKPSLSEVIALACDKSEFDIAQTNFIKVVSKNDFLLANYFYKQVSIDETLALDLEMFNMSVIKIFELAYMNLSVLSKLVDNYQNGVGGSKKIQLYYNQLKAMSQVVQYYRIIVLPMLEDIKNIVKQISLIPFYKVERFVKLRKKEYLIHNEKYAKTHLFEYDLFKKMVANKNYSLGKAIAENLIEFADDRNLVTYLCETYSLSLNVVYHWYNKVEYNPELAKSFREQQTRLIQIADIYQDSQERLQKTNDL